TGVGGHASLQGGGGNDTLNATAGNTQELVGDNAVVLSLALSQSGGGPSSGDPMTAVGDGVTVNGLGGDDRLHGRAPSYPAGQNIEAGDNAFIQLVPDDTMFAGPRGDVLVEGGGGDDTLTGAAGNNTLIGDSGAIGVSVAALLSGLGRVVAAVGRDSI